MKQESRLCLEAILAKQGQESVPTSTPKPLSDDEIQFAPAYERVRGEVLLPALREFAAVLENKGHACEVVEEISPGHHPELAITGLRLYPPGRETASLSDFPTVMFTPDAVSRRVLVSVHLNGANTTEDQPTIPYDLDCMSADVIEAEVLRLVDRVLGNHKTREQNPS